MSPESFLLILFMVPLSNPELFPAGCKHKYICSGMWILPTESITLPGTEITVPGKPCITLPNNKTVSQGLKTEIRSTHLQDI